MLYAGLCGVASPMPAPEAGVEELRTASRGLPACGSSQVFRFDLGQEGRGDRVVRARSRYFLGAAGAAPTTLTLWSVAKSPSYTVAVIRAPGFMPLSTASLSTL